MVALAIGLLLTAASPLSTKLSTICKVGRIAIRDLPNVNVNKGFDAYYAALNQNRNDLLTACPRLKHKIPKGYPIADADALSRAAVHAPIPGQHVREAFIYSIGVPEVSIDSRSAVVHFSYSCTGLCGGELEARYVRTSQGWQRDGAIRTVFVS